MRIVDKPKWNWAQDVITYGGKRYYYFHWYNLKRNAIKEAHKIEELGAKVGAKTIVSYGGWHRGWALHATHRGRRTLIGKMTSWMGGR